MSDDNFGPWIDWNGGECPIPDAKAGDWQLRWRDGRVDFETVGAKVYSWENNGAEANIIAYRVRLPAEDRLRQAIEALREFMSKADPAMTTERDHPHAVFAETFLQAASVLTAYDKREQS